MSCSFNCQKGVGPSQEGDEISICGIERRDARITAFVLGMLSLLLFALSFVFFGLGTLPPTTLMGLGMFPYLGGALLNFTALGLVLGTLVFVAISSVRSCDQDSVKDKKI